jgi:hypothetical protein
MRKSPAPFNSVALSTLVPPGTSLDKRICKALDIIDPAEDRRAACIRDIQMGIGYVSYFRERYLPAQGQQQQELLTLCKVMRQMEKISGLPDWLKGWPSREQIRKEREEREKLVKESEVPRRSGKQRELARIWAVEHAETLLRRYSDKKPTLTRDIGAWHRLASVLYDKPGANLFEDMRVKRSRQSSFGPVRN